MANASHGNIASPERISLQAGTPTHILQPVAKQSDFYQNTGKLNAPMPVIYK
jgi:hypothetical protein